MFIIFDDEIVNTDRICHIRFRKEGTNIDGKYVHLGWQIVLFFSSDDDDWDSCLSEDFEVSESDAEENAKKRWAELQTLLIGKDAALD